MTLKLCSTNIIGANIMLMLRVLVAVLLVSIFEVATAQSYNLDPSEACPPEGDPPKCSIQGQSDLYGMGVRMGVYLSWIASWLANNFVPAEIDAALDTNSIFLLAIAFALALYSGMSRLRVIDGLILIQMSFGFIFTVMTLWGYRTSVYRREGAKGALRFGGKGTSLRLVLLTGLCTFNLWFLNDGMKQAACNRRLACNGIRVWAFVDVSLTSTGRMIYNVLGGIFCTLYFIMLLGALAMFVKLCYEDARSGTISGNISMIKKYRQKYRCLTDKQ